MVHVYDQVPGFKGLNTQCPSCGHMDHSHIPRSPKIKGLAHLYALFWVFKLNNNILMVFYADFRRFLPKTEDLEPVLRPYLRRNWDRIPNSRSL
jgi:hypothetical protein